jgi:subtilisin-like proprotein convertase family protein
MRRAGLALAALVPLALALAVGSPAATQTYTSHQLHAAIPDGGSLVRSLQVPDSGPVSFVAVGVRITHPHVADLTLTLISPAGRKVVLGRHEGGNGANYGSGAKGCSGNLSWFESDALDAVSAQDAPFAGEQRPEQPLTSLYGQEARGRWSLQVDDGTPGAAGTLLCWQLELARNVVSHVRVAHSRVAADLSFRETNNRYNDLRITVRRDGKRALKTSVARLSCKECLVGGFDTITSPEPLTIRDLDGDGEPEVLVDLFTGGAHCCYYTVILRYDGRTYRGKVVLWGDPSYGLRDLDHDGRPEFVTADDRFAYEFTSYAGSVLPIQVRAYDHGVLTDVTSRFPALVRAEANDLRRQYLQYRGNRQDDLRGLLAAWVADEYRLGLGEEAMKQVEAAYRRGELSAPRVDPLWPAGRKYIKALQAFLVKNGYALRS